MKVAIAGDSGPYTIVGDTSSGEHVYPLYRGHELEATSQGERSLIEHVLAVQDPFGKLDPAQRGHLVDTILAAYRHQTTTANPEPTLRDEPDPWASIDVWQAWAASLVAWERAIYDHHGQLTTAQLAKRTRRERQDRQVLGPKESVVLTTEPDPPTAPCLATAVAVASALWPDCPDNADSNVRDAHWLARCVQDQAGIVLPTTVPSVSRGVAIVECVERHYINLAEADKVIREFDANTIAGRCLDLIAAISRHRLSPFPDDERAKDMIGIANEQAAHLACALHTWYGCISLGKVLRATARSPEDVPGQPPTFVPIQQHQRWKGYAFISTLADEEAKRGNPWIRFGMTCTRLFERHRHNLTVDWWLPGDSPYWEG